jgi:diaminopimelate epimerase
MCGNGGRCLVQFAYDVGMQKASYSFLAIDGPHEANFAANGWVRLKMKDVNGITIHDQNFVLDTGSPHYIKMVDDVRTLNVVEAGKQIRYSQDFKQQGVNVNFVQIENDKLVVRTYERGVEDETLSCGTGVTACALACSKIESGSGRMEVETLGGNLAIEYNKINDHEFKNIWLCGPATFVFKGETDI